MYRDMVGDIKGVGRKVMWKGLHVFQFVLKVEKKGSKEGN